MIRAKPFPVSLKALLKKYKKIICLDEQTEPGGLSSLVRENIETQVVNLSLPDKFIYENLGREKLLDLHGLSIKNICNLILKVFKGV